MTFQGPVINSSYTSLIDNGTLPIGTFHIQHLIMAFLTDHFSNSMGFYQTFRPCPGVQEFAPHLGNEHGQGRVALDLAGNVRLVLDEVVYGPRFPRLPMAYDRLFLSLPKLLKTGCTMEVDPRDNWIIRRGGNILIFGIKSPSLPDPEMRIVLGPLVQARQNLGVPQPLQGAVARESPQIEQRPPRDLQGAILRATARDREKPIRSLQGQGQGQGQGQVGRMAAPVEKKPAKPLSDAVSKPSTKAEKSFSKPSQGSASAKPRDAARKHWENLAYRTLPPASKDTK